MSKFLLAGLVALLLLGYGFFEARRLITGPTITIETPQNGSATSSPTFFLRGTAANIAFLTINDRSAFTDEAGNFSERISAPPGYTVLTVEGRDRFGRSAQARVHITMLNYCSLG